MYINKKELALIVEALDGMAKETRRLAGNTYKVAVQRASDWEAIKARLCAELMKHDGTELEIENTYSRRK